MVVFYLFFLYCLTFIHFLHKKSVQHFSSFIIVQCLNVYQCVKYFIHMLSYGQQKKIVTQCACVIQFTVCVLIMLHFLCTYCISKQTPSPHIHTHTNKYALQHFFLSFFLNNNRNVFHIYICIYYTCLIHLFYWCQP